MGNILNKRLKQKTFENIELEAVLNLFLASNYLRSKIDTVCLQHSLTHSQFNVLRILKGTYPNGYSRGEIISRMVEPSPDVTRLIDRLIKEGLVERYATKDDRRLSCTKITQKGVNILSKINPKIKAIISGYTSPLTKTEKNNLSDICEKLYAEELKK
jgi:DNA-binding MarR family transcriptional regulator